MRKAKKRFNLIILDDINMDILAPIIADTLKEVERSQPSDVKELDYYIAGVIARIKENKQSYTIYFYKEG